MRYESGVSWKRGELLGSGAYGNVYLGLNEETGELMACKQVGIVSRHEETESVRCVKLCV